MKTIIIALAALLCSVQLQAQDTPISAFLEKWKNSKTYLLKIAGSMPDSLYNYKPTERQMTFEEQLVHIAGNMNWLSTTYFAEPVPREEKQFETKKALLAYLAKSFDQVYGIIEQTDPSGLNQKVEFHSGKKTRLQILNLLQDHVTHHRGQIIVYLNLNGIAPPDYVGW